jgi:small subunit ribosomal protein S8
MALNDPVADLLTRMRNAIQAKHRYVDLYHSNLKQNILKVLKEKGLIENYLINEENKKARAFLKYAEGRESLITGLRRISSPGLRRYVGHQSIPRIDGGMGLVILSTPKGIMDGETARKLKVGGELLCYIW